MYSSAIALLKGILGNFSDLMKTTPKNEFEKLTSRVKSNGKDEQYWVPDSLSGFKEWLDERHFSDFGDRYLTVLNKKYDTGIKVDRDTINDSRKFLGGNVENWIKSIVQKAVSLPAKLIYNALTANGNWIDGTAFFATSRANIDTGSNTINNLLTGTSSSTYSQSEFEADYKAAKIKLIGFRDKDDEPFNEEPKLAVLVPAHLKDVANLVLADRQQLVYISGTKNNPYAGDAEIIVNYRQAATDNDWFLINMNSPFPAFLVQEREAPKWSYEDSWKSTNILYGVDLRIGAALLNPFCIVKTNN